jgi:hypothetical protein
MCHARGRPSLDQGPSTEQPSAEEPSKTAGGEGTAAKLDAMRQRLQEHSALEDPRPLSGPEASGQEPQQKPPSRSQ